jgi:hypothetical protein
VGALEDVDRLNALEYETEALQVGDFERVQELVPPHEVSMPCLWRGNLREHRKVDEAPLRTADEAVRDESARQRCNAERGLRPLSARCPR